MKIFIVLVSFLFLTACVEETQTIIDKPSAVDETRTIIEHPRVVDETLDKNKKLWEKINIKNYSFVVQRSCFCPHQEKKQITVKKAKLFEAKFIPSNNPVEDTSKEKTITAYFDMIQDALDKNAHQVTVVYDKTYGFPASISIDQDKQMADEEIYYTITHFNQSVGGGGMVCTQEFAPVCAKVDIECVTIPCETEERTFSNKCHLDANPNATYLKDGEC